ncbi:hypothetical protein D9M69_629010 [compost metagenome]
MLADEVAADVGNDRTHQRQHAEAGEGQDQGIAEAAVGMQALVDGGQQRGDGEAADHAQQGGHQDDRPVGLEQLEQFAEGAGGTGGHGDSSMAKALADTGEDEREGDGFSRGLAL